jgi:hypothetical protein
MHLSGSIQSLRDAVHRIPKPRRSSSRTSLNLEPNSKSDATIDDQDQTSITTINQQSKSSK